MSPRPTSGANTAERAPTTMRTSPRATARVGEQPLPRREPGVQDGDPLAGEAPLDARHGLAGEPDLGHEEQDRAAGVQRRLRRLEVDLGLAAAGDAVQQHLVAGVRLAQDAVQRAALLVQKVGDVGEDGAAAQTAGLGRGGAGDPFRSSGPPDAAATGLSPAATAASSAPRVGGEHGAALDQAAQAGGREAAGGAQLALLELPGVVEELERRALPRPEPCGRLRPAAQRAPRRRDADDVHGVGDAQPALAPVALCLGRAGAAAEPQAGELEEPVLAGGRGRPSRVGEIVLAHDLERAGGRADERERARERREVVLLDAAREAEEVGAGWAGRAGRRAAAGRVPRARCECGPRGSPR